MVTRGVRTGVSARDSMPARPGPSRRRTVTSVAVALEGAGEDDRGAAGPPPGMHPRSRS